MYPERGWIWLTSLKVLACDLLTTVMVNLECQLTASGINFETNYWTLLYWNFSQSGYRSRKIHPQYEQWCLMTFQMKGREKKETLLFACLLSLLLESSSSILWLPLLLLHSFIDI